MRRRALALVAGFAALLPFVLLPTTASWTDDAWFAVEASAGTWETGPVVGCVIRDIAGTQVRTCTVSAAISGSWNSGPGTPSTVQYVVTVSPTPVANQYAEFTVDLSGATGTLPSGWTWAQAGTRDPDERLTVNTRCSDLPLLTGRIRQWNNQGGLNIVQNRTTQGPVNCT